jgi:type IV secretion system protein VirB10
MSAPSPLSAPAPQAVLSQAPQPGTALAPRANPAAAPTVVFDASALPLGPAAALAPGAPASTGNGNDDFASRLGADGKGSAAATQTIDPRTTVTQGTLIPAVLETAIDTDVPGYVRAVVSADVRSFDGARVLVPRSSRLIGQYKSGLQAGQKRAYVIWTRLLRPDGVSVALGSPAIAFSGETGLAGKVNSHFFERFGSAMLLSVVGGLSAIGGNASVLIGSGGQSAAAAAVGQSGQIGPTIRVRQGEPIRVFTAKDLDFSKVTPL